MNLLKTITNIKSLRQPKVKHVFSIICFVSTQNRQRQQKQHQMFQDSENSRIDDKKLNFSNFAIQMGLDKQFKELNRRIIIQQKQSVRAYSFIIGLASLIFLFLVFCFTIQEQKIKNVKLWKTYVLFMQTQLEIEYLTNNQKSKKDKLTIFLAELYQFAAKFISQSRLNSNQNMLGFAVRLIPHFQQILALPQEKQKLNKLLSKIIFLPPKVLKKPQNLLQIQKIVYNLLYNQENIPGIKDYCVTLCENGNIRQQYLGFIYLKKFLLNSLKSLDNRKKQIIQGKVRENQTLMIQKYEKIKSFQKLSQNSYQFDSKRIDKLKQMFTCSI